MYSIPTDVADVNYKYSLNTNFPNLKKFDDDDFSTETEGVYRYVCVDSGRNIFRSQHIVKALFDLSRVRELATATLNHYNLITIDNVLEDRALELAGEANRWVVLKRTSK